VLSDEDRRTLLRIYGASAREIATEMKAMLGAWQADPESTDWIDALLARAHRLRGDSTTVDLHSTVELLRGFESMLRAMRSWELFLTRERGALLAAVVDQLAEVASDALDGESEDSAPHKNLMERLRIAITTS
jgi:chemotaxis protein histidine kinase CheA